MEVYNIATTHLLFHNDLLITNQCINSNFNMIKYLFQQNQIVYQQETILAQLVIQMNTDCYPKDNKRTNFI